jgi:hypothetical protein
MPGRLFYLGEKKVNPLVNIRIEKKVIKRKEMMMKGI